MVYRIGVDIGATRTMLALIEGSRPEIVAHERPSTDVLFTGWRPPGLALAGAVQRFMRENQIDPKTVVGVGVGVPGLVDSARGTVLSCPNFSLLNGASLGPEASEELGMPVYVNNNTNLIALGEHTAGLGRGVNDMAAVFVGSGVGCGLILNGQLYEGADGAAGEFGHTIIVPDGLACTCGARGCVEMYCSAKALTLIASNLFNPGELFSLGTRFAGAQLVIEQANAGNPKALQAMMQAFRYLGLALINLVNILNPRLIVLGGGVIFAWPESVHVVRDIVMQEARLEARRNLRIELSELQNFAGVLGGAALVSSSSEL